MEPNTPAGPIPSQGPVVGIIVVLIVLVVGAFYFFTRLSEMNVPEPAATTSDTIVFPPASASDDPSAIEEDLEAEDFSNIDAQMRTLEPEFGY